MGHAASRSGKRPSPRQLVESCAVTFGTDTVGTAGTTNTFGAAVTNSCISIGAGGSTAGRNYAVEICKQLLVSNSELRQQRRLDLLRDVT